MNNYGEISNYKNKKGVKENSPDFKDEELKFILWKAELNKELLSFWKSMTKD
jgi:hypothetical protein